MKKNFLSMALAVFALSVNAQTSKTDSVKSSSFKPDAKTVTTELNFNPFKGNLSLNNSFNQVKVRYFILEDLALRLGANLSSRDSLFTSGTPYGTQSNWYKDKRKSTSYGINLGVEKHFKGTSRLSPYVGADFSFGSRSSDQDISNSNGTIKVKNAWSETVYVTGQNFYYTQLIENAYNRFGILLIAGFDFYMAKNFYCGYEFNLGYSKTSYKTAELIPIPSQGNNSPVTNDNSSSTLGTSLMNGIRIGYAF